MANNIYEILNDCFNPQNGTINITPDNAYEVLNAIYDSTNHALKVNLSGAIDD